MADFYQPPSYQRPLSGRVVNVVQGEPNPLHKVSILRRGQEIIISAYLDDPTYHAVPIGDDVQVARDSGGTWRIQRRTEYQLANFESNHKVEAGRIDGYNINFTRMVSRAQGESLNRASVAATAHDVVVSAYMGVRDNNAETTELRIAGNQLNLGKRGARLVIGQDSRDAAITAGGAVADWTGGALNVGAADDTDGNAIGVLCAPDAGLPASLELPVSGQAPNMIATLNVSQLLQLATALQVYPSGLSGHTPAAPTPPPEDPDITGLTAGTARVALRWRRDLFALLVVWEGGTENTTAVRTIYRGRPGQALADAEITLLHVLESALGGDSLMRRQVLWYYEPIRKDILLTTTTTLATEDEFMFIALVDMPISNMDIPAGITVPAITDGATIVSVGNARWDLWEFETATTQPAPSAAPEQVVIGHLRLADGYRFGTPP